MRGKRTGATRTRIAVADTARAIRTHFRASRRYVSDSLENYAGRRRGTRVADGLVTLAGWMLDGGMSPEQARHALQAIPDAAVEEAALQRIKLVA